MPYYSSPTSRTLLQSPAPPRFPMEPHPHCSRRTALRCGTSYTCTRRSVSSSDRPSEQGQPLHTVYTAHIRTYVPVAMVGALSASTTCASTCTPVLHNPYLCAPPPCTCSISLSEECDTLRTCVARHKALSQERTGRGADQGQDGKVGGQGREGEGQGGGGRREAVV